MCRYHVRGICKNRVVSGFTGTTYYTSDQEGLDEKPLKNKEEVIAVVYRISAAKIMVMDVISEKDEIDSGQSTDLINKIAESRLRRLSWWKQAAKYRVVSLVFTQIFVGSAACSYGKIVVFGEETGLACSR